MTRRHDLAVLCLAAGVLAALPPVLATSGRMAQSSTTPIQAGALQGDLDRIFDDPALARALVGVRVESLSTGRIVYERNADKLMIPASNMKIVTVATAAARLGWNYRYETLLEAVGGISGGTLTGDLVVTGSGDPSIGSPDGGDAPVFLEWADAVRRAGIHRVDGRIVGDDNAFDDDVLGAGWAWDNLVAGYAAPVSALNYNENVAVVRVSAAPRAGDPAVIELTPPGHTLAVENDVSTGSSASPLGIAISRRPGSARIQIRGTTPAGGPGTTRTVAVDNPTQFFVEALRLALASRGITVTGGAWDIDDIVPRAATSSRTTIAARTSAPLSSLAGYAMKVSQNFYAEAFLKTLGRSTGIPGSAEGGRQAVREALADWGIPSDSLVMSDGSGLSRYNYTTAATIVTVLERIWHNEELRGRFAALLPVGGHDGTLAGRMRDSPLDRNVQAKTGTLNNVRALSGYLRAGDERLVFSMIVNHHTAPAAEVDALVERALVRLARPGDAPRDNNP